MALDFNGPSFQQSSEVFCHHREFILDGAADTDTNKQYIATTQADLSVSFIRILTSEICMVAKKSLQPPNMQSRRNFRRTREKIGTNKAVHFEKTRLILAFKYILQCKQWLTTIEMGECANGLMGKWVISIVINRRRIFAIFCPSLAFRRHSSWTGNGLAALCLILCPLLI